jgi:sugar phosphate isomerase/epimerase
MKSDPARPILPCVFCDEVAEDFEEAVRLSAEAGAVGLELRGRMWGKSIGQIDDPDAARIKEVCARHGVRVAVIGSPVGKCDMESPDELAAHQKLFGRMAELAHTFGTDLIRGFALWRPNRSRETDHLRPNLDEYLPRILDFLGPIVDEAGRNGVRFSLENEGATLVGTCAEAHRVMDALGSPAALGATWDTGNGWECGENPYPDGYEQIRGRIFHFHVKPDMNQSLATVPGESFVTHEEVLRRLIDDGYRGWASIEHWGAPELMLKGLRELTPVLERL